MKKRLVLILTALVGFAVLPIGAKAQEFDQLRVTVPYEFVVLGKTLHAGTYRLSRIETSTGHELILKNVNNSEAVLMIAREIEGPRADELGFTFRNLGGEHFLSEIRTGDYSFAVPVSKSAVLEASNRSRQVSKSSEPSGN